jgi:hypothetical protein
LTLGLYSNFPVQIHLVEEYSTTLPVKELQQRLIQVFYEANKREFTFEEAANPTIPGAKVIFEFGLADGYSFTFIERDEYQKALELLGKEDLNSLDFLCSIRYYKSSAQSKVALKFDYYLLRTIYGNQAFEIQVSHQKGPRYISPQDLIEFVEKNVNLGSKKKILKKANAEPS